ncbi:hypothetical protein K458DRAFT_468751 [Lentithecium fluviatile CBS 122367]|uniref:Uncharacterized protein n=1 Tax=Lentithecium fluviatile CBS 122367 TaxID=1168545 RepID=A0A6G1IDN9_9PLEO|nr:hypothetical protein K458DRAFT_468751 [Lentithecium fluviatile CBS 122367]
MAVNLSEGDVSSGNIGTLGTSQSRLERLSQIADTTSETTTARRDPPLPYFSVPVSRNTDFFGRGELLERLAESLCPTQPGEDSTHVPSLSTLPSGSRDLKTFAICGAGGLGKTQVAAQFVHEYRDSFDAIFWLHAEEDVILRGEFAHIAVQLNLVPEASQEASNLFIARELVKGWLAKPTKTYSTHGRTSAEEASWLLVFDNVAQAETLLDFWPEAGSCGSILLTSRDPLAKSGWYKVSDGIILKEFDPREATEFLLKSTWRENDEKARALAPDVVGLLGCHPLALVQMSSIIVREQLSYEDFIKRYQEEAAHAELFEQSFVSKQQQQTSSHTISSVWLLDSLQFGAGLLHAMSFFDPDGIQDDLLESAIGLENTHHFPPTTTKYQKARGELLNSSLISKDASERKLLVHRLTQDAVWAKLASSRDMPTEAVASFNSAVYILQNVWPRAGYAERHKRERWDRCEVYAGHVLRLKNRFSRAALPLKVTLRNNIHLADLLNESNLTSMLDDDASSFPQAVVTRAKFLLAETHRNLGCSAAEHVRPQAAKFHFIEYNKLMKEEFNGKGPTDDSRLAISHFELATAYIMLEDWEQAENCNLTALEEAKKLTDPLKAKYTCSLPQINLAFVYLLTGHIDKAEPLLNKTLKEREEIYGPNDRVSMITGRVYHGLGLLKEAQGKLDESYRFQMRALNHMKDTAGPYHHRTADMYFKVAQHLVRLEKTEMAIEHLDLAMKTYNNQACYCAERARVAYWRAKLAARHHGTERAAPFFTEAFKLYKEARPGDNRSLEQLSEKDFDRPVTFWSK